MNLLSPLERLEILEADLVELRKRVVSLEGSPAPEDPVASMFKRCRERRRAAQADARGA